MHELFITAAITPSSVTETLQILQGYTHMIPVQIFKRKFDFKGPKGPQEGGPPLPGLTKELMRPRMPGEAERRRCEAWAALDQRIMKMAFYIPLTWREDPDRNASPPIECNLRPGTLRFVEKPDVFAKPIISRGVIQIENELYLPRILEASGYTKVSENFAEIWQCFHNGMSFELMRILVNPETGDIDVTKLRDRDHCAAFGNKWILTVKVEVADGNKPDQINQARQMLLKVSSDLGDNFEFGHLDPASMDPRARWA